MLDGMELSQEGALLADTFGPRLLAYLCAADDAAVASRLEGTRLLGDSQEEVLAQLLVLARQLASNASQNNVPVAMGLDVLGRFDEGTQTSNGNFLRLHAGGGIDIEIPDDPVLGPLTTLLRDAYPLTLVPLERTFFPRLNLSAALWSSPHRKAFEAGVLDDPDLSRLFVAETETGGWTSMVYRSTGSGGSLQLWSLPDILLTNAWWSTRLTQLDQRDELAGQLALLVDLLRRASRGEPCEVAALVAFTGIVLDSVDQIQLPFGVLRPIRDHERELAPPSLEGRVSHTTADGDSVTASYAGDVVLETTVTFRIRIEQEDLDSFAEWPTDMRDYETLESRLDTLRLASLLAAEAETSLTLAPTWRSVFDPLSWGPLLSWNDPRVGPSIAPQRMLPDAATKLGQWTAAVHASRRRSFDVAVRRVISASATRVDQIDALVDLVIAWENLFGSRQGEPTLRISAALGWLLGTTSEEREHYRARVAKTYALRSDIVHGNRIVAPQEASEMLVEARAITLGALRKLFDSRTDLLALQSGDERSRALIMGGPPS